VHARSRAPAWSGWLACRATGTPFVTTYHGIYGEVNPVKRFYNSVMVRGAAVIANSRYTSELIAARYGTPPERIVVIPRGIDLQRFDPDAVDEARRKALHIYWGIAPADRVVLNLARLASWKGQRMLIDAMAEPPLARLGGVLLVLAGDAQGRERYVEALGEQVIARQLSGRVRIVGHCEDAAAALAIADVAVIASAEAEAFGRTAIEAAAMGVPLVATALGATAETVLAPPAVPDAERTGWLVPPDDPGAMAGAVASALALQPEERRRLAARARRHAGHFTTEKMQDATLALYDRLMRPPDTPTAS
jgi:glycosyltransferase involved in cell wall biosynthesis